MHGRRCSRQTELLCAAKHELFELEASGFDLDRPLPDYKPRMEKVTALPVAHRSVAQRHAQRARSIRWTHSYADGTTQCGRSTVSTTVSLSCVASHRIAHCTCTQTPAPTWCDVLCHCKASLVGATPRRSTNVGSLGSKRDGHRHVDKFAAWHDPRYLRRLLRARDRMPNRAAATCQAVCCMPHVCAVNGGVARPISGDVFAVRCDAVNRSISSVAAACCVSRYSALLSNQSVADRYRTVRYRRSTRSTRTVANRSFLLNQRLMRLWSVQTPRS